MMNSKLYRRAEKKLQGCGGWQQSCISDYNLQNNINQLSELGKVAYNELVKIMATN